MNLPNKITVGRILLVPIMIIVALISIPGDVFGIPIKNIILDIIFIIGSVSDHIDGKLARKNNQVTVFGKFLDPIADKILVVSAMIILVEQNIIPSWIPIIVILREFVVSGYRLVAVQNNGEVIAANIWGKIKTTTQMIAVILAFVSVYGFGQFASVQMPIPFIIINVIMTICMIACVIATLFSGYTYLKGGKELLKDM